MSIQAHFDQIENLFTDFNEQKLQIEIMENLLYDMYTNPVRFGLTSCPVNVYSLHFLGIANNRLFAMNIYTVLESLYTEIIKDFDPTCIKPDIWNIKIPSVIGKISKKSKEGKIIYKDISRRILFKGIETSISFDHSTSPAYSIIHSFSEWRGANAHYSLGTRYIDISSFGSQFILHKIALVALHDKLLRYLLELKNPGFAQDFDSFI